MKMPKYWQLTEVVLILERSCKDEAVKYGAVSLLPLVLTIREFSIIFIGSYSRLKPGNGRVSSSTLVWPLPEPAHATMKDINRPSLGDYPSLNS